MIHVVNAANAPMYRRQIEEMHRIRKVVFVDQLRWSGPNVVGDQEFDAYDDVYAEYLLGLDPHTGAVRAGMRMRPARTSSLLADVFAHLVANGRDAVLDAETAEGTRLFAAPDARSEADRQLMRDIYAAAVAYCIRRGFRRFTGLGDVKHLPYLRTGGWRFTMLGAPVSDAEGEWFAFEARCDGEALAHIRDRHNVHGELLFEMPEVDEEFTVAPQVAERVLGPLFSRIRDQ